MVKELPEVDRSPYLAAKRDLDGREARQDKIINRLWMTNISLTACLFASTGWAIYQSTIPRRVPFPMLINELGEKVASGFKSNADPSDAMAKTRRDRMQLFVEDFRGVTTDTDLENQKIMRVWYLVQADSSAYNMMDHFFRDERNPLAHAAEKGPVTVNVESVLLSTSGHTYVVEWLETQYDRKGLITGHERWRGEFSFADGPSTDTNPLGIYINAVSWTKFREAK